MGYFYLQNNDQNRNRQLVREIAFYFSLITAASWVVADYIINRHPNGVFSLVFLSSCFPLYMVVTYKIFRSVAIYVSIFLAGIVVLIILVFETFSNDTAYFYLFLFVYTGLAVSCMAWILAYYWELKEIL